MMVESLSECLEQVRITSQLLGIKYMEGIISINHSQFVDDTILLGGASSTMVDASSLSWMTLWRFMVVK